MVDGFGLYRPLEDKLSKTSMYVAVFASSRNLDLFKGRQRATNTAIKIQRAPKMNQHFVPFEHFGLF